MDSVVASDRSAPGLPQHVLTQHFPALDGLRGVAVLMVIVSHFIAYRPGPPAPRFFSLVGSIGAMGVDLFFALSGFLITRILLRARGRPHFLKNFYTRRVLRIFPLYYGFLFGIYIVIPALHVVPMMSVRQQLWSWTYMQNVVMTFNPVPSANLWQWTPHFWSLAVEEHFYLVWPFLVSHAHERRLQIILLGAIPFAILSRCIVIWSGYGPAYLTPCRIDTLAMGSLLAIAIENRERFGRLSRFATRILLIAIPSCLAALFLLSGRQLSVVQIFKDTVAGAFFSLVLLLVLNARPGQFLYAFFSNRVLAACGKYSYGMYVIHLTIIGLLLQHLGAIWPPLALLILVAVVFCAAALIWQFWERPFLSLKDHFNY